MATSSNNTINNMEWNDSAKFELCIIEEVHDDLTADIYIPSKSYKLVNIPFCFPSKNNSCGSYFVPCKKTVGILLTIERDKRYIITNLQFGEYQCERVLEGENVLKSLHGALFRQSNSGNTIIASPSLNLMNVDEEGTNILFSNKVFDYSKSSLAIKGMSKQGFNVDCEYFYSGIKSNKALTEKDILILDNGTLKINSDIKNKIIDDIGKTLNKYSAFNDEIDNMVDLNNGSQISDDKIKSIDKYKQKQDTLLEIQKGSVINKKLSSSRDIETLEENDYAKSQYNEKLLYRVKIENVETGEVIFCVELDKIGDININISKADINIKDKCNVKLKEDTNLECEKTLNIKSKNINVEAENITRKGSFTHTGSISHNGIPCPADIH